jgi:hypothetical protein
MTHRDAQRPRLAVRLGDVRPAYGGPAVSFPLQEIDDSSDLLEAHTIHRFVGGPLRHRPGVAVDLAVTFEEQAGVEQVFVDTFQGQPSGPSILVDYSYCVGITHRTYLAVSSPVHLPPFAMRPAFPASDYYGGSVAVGLSPRRRSRISSVIDVQDGSGASFMPLGSFTTTRASRDASRRLAW